MKPLELATLIMFLLSYGFIAVRAVFTPVKYREEEIRFYRTGKLRFDQWASFLPGILAVGLMVAHFIIEGARIGQGLLYLQVVFIALVLPFHFVKFLRKRIAGTLNTKSGKDYRNSGLRKFGIILLVIAIPLIYRG